MTDDDEWGELDSTLTECASCGTCRPCELRVDPFLDEIYPEDGPYVPKWWCRPCWEDRHDDV